ncbi:MlaD family protein [Parvularcula lutaonensis]|uniref:MlaD family protein n=1 Tax=Parvularcula lutaonensis TaxID=491923 RepID=A0ABV7MDH2_9PROT|nr:MlaD family protein [Parvularcula lutaonensis]GGY52545.1 ABC transporter permease [Parvularcula lutaonensis]
METRAHYVLIGASVVATLVMAVIFALWLGNTERAYDEYYVVFNERVSGLQVGAAVQFNGIRVGEVEELTLDQRNPNIARALIRVEENTPIKEDTRAELELVGVTGLSIIQFVGGDPNAPLLKQISNERIPTIQGSAGGLAAVIESSGPLAENITNLVSAENIDRISRILEDIETLTDTVADSDQDITTIIHNAATMSIILRRNVEKLDETTDRINAILAETEDLMKTDVRETLQRSAESAEELSLAMSEINDILSDNRPAIDAFAQEGLGATVGVIAQANRVLATTEAILQEFERDPAKFLLGKNRPEARP